MSGQPLVVMTQVNKTFGHNHVLRDIDLTVDRGEVVVVLGPSGSGKSTLCRCINRLERIDSGSITVDGQPLPEEVAPHNHYDVRTNAGTEHRQCRYAPEADCFLTRDKQILRSEDVKSIRYYSTLD